MVERVIPGHEKGEKRKGWEKMFCLKNTFLVVGFTQNLVGEVTATKKNEMEIASLQLLLK